MAHQEGGELHATETEVSGGSKEGVVRWVLVIGLILAVAFLSIIWMTGALTQDADESQVNVTRKIQANEADTSTDSIVTKQVDSIDNADAAAADAPDPALAEPNPTTIEDAEQ